MCSPLLALLQCLEQIFQILIHRSPADAIETGSGSRKDNSDDEDELNSSGSGSYNPVTETYIDDEDYEQLDTIKNDVSCLLPDSNKADLTTVSNNVSEIQQFVLILVQNSSIRLFRKKTPLFMKKKILRLV